MGEEQKAKDALTAAREHLQKALSEQVFATNMATEYLSGHAADNVKRAAKAAVQEAKHGVVVALARLKKVKGNKVDMDRKLEQDQASAKRLDVVSSKAAAKAALLQR